MYRFLFNNRDKLIAQCSETVSERLKRNATPEQLCNGISLVIDQLARTLEAVCAHAHSLLLQTGKNKILGQQAKVS